MTRQIYLHKSVAGRFDPKEVCDRNRKAEQAVNNFISQGCSYGGVYETPVIFSHGTDGKKLGPEQVLVGYNACHNAAYFISDLPLLVLDQHTDTYFSPNDNLLDCIDKPIKSNNWIFWRLLKQEDVHIVLPTAGKNYSHFYPNNTVPKNAIDKLHVYAYGRKTSLPFYVVEDERGVTVDKEIIDTALKRGLSARDLVSHLDLKERGYEQIDVEIGTIDDLHKKLEGVPIQVSIDLDFNDEIWHGTTRGTHYRIMRAIKPYLSKENIFDVWISDQNTTTSLLHDILK